MSKKYVQICFDEIQRETEKAILVEGTWLPKSQLLVAMNYQTYSYKKEQIIEHKEKTPYCLLLPLWLHMKNGMSFKKSQLESEWHEDFNQLTCGEVARGVQQYENIKIVSYKEYQSYKEGK